MSFWYTEMTPPPPPPPPSLFGKTIEDTVAMVLVLVLTGVLAWRVYQLVSTLSKEMCYSAIYIVVIPVLIHLLLMYGLPISNLGALRERWIMLLNSFNSTATILAAAPAPAPPSSPRANYLMKAVEYYWNRN